MADKPNQLPVTDPLHVLPEFFSIVAGSGTLNGVCNITLAVANFTPRADGKIDPDLVVNVRLRSDLSGIQQLRDACDALIAQNIKPNGKKDN